VGPAWVGDIVMAQSLFKTIKEHSDDAIIDVLAPNWSRALLDRMPEVRQSFVMPIGHGRLALKKRYQIAQTFKSESYSQAMVLPNSWKSALIPWWAGIPKRTGFLGEFRYVLLNDYRRLDKQRLPRMIDRFAYLAYKKDESISNTVPYPRLEISETTLLVAKQKFELDGKDEKRPVLALCPGAEFGASKRWPESYYATVAEKKLKDGWDVWIFGSKNDSPVAKAIQEAVGNRCLDLTGKTALDEAIDLLSLASIVLTNDSGLMHIAAALQKPLIAVYGSTDPGFTPPLGGASQIVRLSLACSPCFKRECPLGHHKCMRDLYPEKVLSVIDAVVV